MERTIRQLLFTVRISAAVLDIKLVILPLLLRVNLSGIGFYTSSLFKYCFIQ